MADEELRAAEERLKKYVFQQLLADPQSPAVLEMREHLLSVIKTEIQNLQGPLQRDLQALKTETTALKTLIEQLARDRMDNKTLKGIEKQLAAIAKADRKAPLAIDEGHRRDERGGPIQRETAFDRSLDRDPPQGRNQHDQHGLRDEGHGRPEDDRARQEERARQQEERFRQQERERRGGRGNRGGPGDGFSLTSFFDGGALKSLFVFAIIAGLLVLAFYAASTWGSGPSDTVDIEPATTEPAPAPRPANEMAALREGAWQRVLTDGPMSPIPLGRPGTRDRLCEADTSCTYEALSPDLRDRALMATASRAREDFGCRGIQSLEIDASLDGPASRRLGLLRECVRVQAPELAICETMNCDPPAADLDFARKDEWTEPLLDWLLLMIAAKQDRR